MVWRYFVLDKYVSSHISSTYLKDVDNDLQSLTDAGFTVTVRFCYTLKMKSQAPYGDANKYWVLEHIKQLKPILQKHEGVLTSVEAGFIGIWGEWYYTTHFGDPNKRDHHKYPKHGYSDSIWNDRKEVLTAVLDAVPQSVQVQIRYPSIKRDMWDEKPTSYSEILKHGHKARTGHHNDCFLSSDNDVGTYHNKAVDYPYLHADTEYCVIGGETCAVTKNDRDKCPTALKEMAYFHWTFLNEGYNRDVYAIWKKDGCYEEVHRRLGYRLSLSQTILPDSVHPGGTLCYQFTIKNDGFAAPAKSMNVYIVLHSQHDGKYFAAELSHDTRTWQPGHHDIQGSVHVTRAFQQGSYDTYLAIGDKVLKDRSDFYVLLANKDVPDHAAGLNNLHHTVKVDTHHSGDAGSCASIIPWTPPKRSRHSRVFKGLLYLIITTLKNQQIINSDSLP
ncbi:hypothetical protein SNE40_011511 [Patella caerulea]|uniref:DUF4832 domain-containing protein n=1 Tax=Patella caerulea TaxID=87958 RepID=A0AAN8PIK2_PATCE